MDLEKIREAAERVARSQGLEIFDVEWKIGKQRLLRVYLDRLPDPANPDNLGVSHADCQRVSEQLSVILDVEDLVPGPATSGVEFAGHGSKVDQAGRLRTICRPTGEDLAGDADREPEISGRAIGRIRERQCEAEVEGREIDIADNQDSQSESGLV